MAPAAEAAPQTAAEKYVAAQERARRLKEKEELAAEKERARLEKAKVAPVIPLLLAILR